VPAGTLRKEDEKVKNNWFASRVARFFSGTTYQNEKNIYQKTIKYTKWPQNIPKGVTIGPMAIKYTIFFHCKTLQNLSKLGFLVWKCTIWQPCSAEAFGPPQLFAFLRTHVLSSNLGDLGSNLNWAKKCD
jgi:hypothetical protein